MTKAERYRSILRNLDDWDDYLLNESGLPGPRANLELLEAVVEEGDEEKFSHFLSYLQQPTDGTAAEFLAVCGVAGQGKLVTLGQHQALADLRSYASDSRWRIREAVAIALQRVGDFDLNRLITEMESWSKGTLLEKRAVVAALCEPRLLKSQDKAGKVLELLNHITLSLLKEAGRRDEHFKVLRKTLGYGWSVAAAAYPVLGKRFLEEWFECRDKDVQWIMRENLKKERLVRMDREWTAQWRSVVGVK